MSVTVLSVEKASPCAKKGMLAGDILHSINRHLIRDVLDYDFYASEKLLTLEISRGEKSLTISLRKKDEYEDLGLRFSTYLMDEQRSCRNNCVFCFIDQMPPGMRDSLYFKDDDDRLSFLFGNYITLTNLSEVEIDRIIEMHISPVNISVHTTNPVLRAEMMKNRFAGDALSHLYKLAVAGVKLNCQLVLCPSMNDGDELVRTLTDLTALYPSVDSIACVPVGLTRYREGLPQLTEFTPEGAASVIDIIESFSKKFRERDGVGLCYPADEFFLKAGRPIPTADYYDAFVQIENGVGMISSMQEEFEAAIERMLEDEPPSKDAPKRTITIATGVAARGFLQSLVDTATSRWNNLSCKVISVENDFFGHSITVAGLLTGQDILKRLRGEDLGDQLLLSEATLRNERDRFLDDMTPEELEEALGASIRFCSNDGADFLDALLGIEY